MKDYLEKFAEQEVKNGKLTAEELPYVMAYWMRINGVEYEQRRSDEGRAISRILSACLSFAARSFKIGRRKKQADGAASSYKRKIA